jgi:hypothetical protein
MRAIALILPALVALSGCSEDPTSCGNDIIRRIVAPGGQHSVVIFQRDCGATTGFSTQVSILGPRDRLEGAGNAYRADDDHGAAAAGSWGGPWVEAQWIAPNQLLIRIAAKSRMFAQNTSVSGVRITYQTVNR